MVVQTQGFRYFSDQKNVIAGPTRRDLARHMSMPWDMRSMISLLEAAYLGSAVYDGPEQVRTDGLCTA